MEIKALTADLPYPSLSALTPDRKQCDLLFSAYAAPASELNTILQYIYHSMQFEKADMYDVSHALISIAVCEMDHLHLLGQAIIKLGGDPEYVYNCNGRRNFYSTSAVTYSTDPCQMILNDITGENGAIEGYKHILSALDGAPLSALISRIIMDEELHLTTLKNIYSELCYK